MNKKKKQGVNSDHIFWWNIASEQERAVTHWTRIRFRNIVPVRETNLSRWETNVYKVTLRAMSVFTNLLISLTSKPNARVNGPGIAIDNSNGSDWLLAIPLNMAEVSRSKVASWPLSRNPGNSQSKSKPSRAVMRITSAHDFRKLKVDLFCSPSTWLIW